MPKSVELRKKAFYKLGKNIRTISLPVLKIKKKNENNFDPKCTKVLGIFAIYRFRLDVIS
jgi:hypothetical protein